MPPKKPPAAVAVASTGCHGLVSCLSLRRGERPSPPPRCGDALPRPGPLDGDAAAEQYWKRMQCLEDEIKKLGGWLGQEENLIECVRAREERAQEMVRLEDGSYLHEMRRTERPWGRLAVQVSPPVVSENAPTASEVLRKMTMLKMEDLAKVLVELTPMRDIAGRRMPGEAVRKPARLSSRHDILEAVLFSAMGKMEGLVLQGLKIQTSSTDEPDAAVVAVKETAAGKDCMVCMVLIQVRDPREGYMAIGEPMIGLVEASPERKDGKVKFDTPGLHVAGMTRTSDDDDRGVLWSASLSHCKALHNGGGGGGGRCSYVRNPNLVFLR